MNSASNPAHANCHHTTVSKAAMVTLWQNHGLTRQMIKREVGGRYRGSMLGIVSSFFNPVFLLAGAFIAWTGLFCFQKTRKGYADVL